MSRKNNFSTAIKKSHLEQQGSQPSPIEIKSIKQLPQANMDESVRMMETEPNMVFETTQVYMET